MATEPLPGVGSTIGSYRIVAMLGHGGMGVVYRAEDLRLGRHVALKLLSSSLAADDGYRRRFLRESQLAASIEHAAILPIYDAGEADGLLYIAMRFIDGVDLAELLRREGPLEPQRAVALIGMLASALDAAHGRSLIHRDVKPSNALIGTDGDGEHAYLVDFGLTQAVDTDERLTATGQLVGTLDYLAPERLRGEEVDGRADIYSLGCVLFQCLTGEVPFRRESEAATIYAHLEEPPPRPSELRPGVPPGLDAVVARALAKDRADRYATGAALTAAARAAIAPRTAAGGGARLAGLPRRGLSAALALLLLATAGGVALLARDGAGGLRGLDGNVVGRIDAESGNILGPQYPVGRDPGVAVVGGGSVWVGSQRDGTVSRIDRRGGVVRIPVPDRPAGMAFAAGSLWVAENEARRVAQIDPQSSTIVQSIDVGNAPSAVAVGFGSLWVTSEVDRKVFRVDLARAVMTDEVDLATNATAVAAGAGAVWVTSEESGSVFRIEPDSGAVSETVDVGDGPSAVVVTSRAVWVANRQEGTVTRIDPATVEVTDTVRVGGEPSALAAGAGSVWVAGAADGAVVRIDPATRRVAERIEVGADSTALAVTDGAVWTATRPSPASHRGGTLTVEMWRTVHGLKLEPASYDWTIFQELGLSHDGLVSYRRTDSSTHGGLVGGLATDVPDPSPDGLTYVFKLRPGLRFSDGTRVRPEDFRASFEDLLTRHGRELPAFYQSIAGVPQCVRRPERCDLSDGIRTNAAARTITLHLTEPDPELMARLAFPLAYVAPADHPFRPKTPVPGTGPYRIVSFDPKRSVRLVRNPHFQPRPSAGRPEGLPDKIEFRLNESFSRSVAAVERGDADVAIVVSPFGGPWAKARIAALAARAPGQLYTDAGSETDYIFLNVRVPPFDDKRVRQALNYAVDRREIERRAGGVDLAQLACGLPPPGFPGYTPACRYTARPDPGGAWHAPDLDRARRLVRASGTAGQEVVVWGWKEKRSLMAYVAAVLRRLGYVTSLKVFPNFSAYGGPGWDPKNRVQLGIVGWQSDVAVPSDFATQFRCSSYLPKTPVANQNGAAFCDRRIEARAREASRTRDSETTAIWQDVYRMLDEAAPYVALVHRRALTLVSERVGNYKHHPLHGPLFEQMWVR